ncbi:hypothetical protein [Angustibacter sp. Root456]|uniref:hypothetical protein n=1 Tax=Angustibacter sp. Root456 TaxID=1736539 RepID=UPI0006FB55CC|nr:hypothetical protein [Angustibacter sp. Root456]KQX66811.1 hypothetical protein ASD06_05695 [Angustibacter sp. Root456]
MIRPSPEVQDALAAVAGDDSVVTVGVRDPAVVAARGGEPVEHRVESAEQVAEIAVAYAGRS